MTRVLVIIFIIVGCSAGTNEPYWNEEKLVTVLADLRIVDHYVKKHLPAQKDSVKLYYREILEDIHTITVEDIEFHLKYVQSDPEIAKSLEEKVLAILNQRLKAIQDYQ